MPRHIALQFNGRCMRGLALLALACAPGIAYAQLAACAAILAPEQRLACYDRLAQESAEKPASVPQSAQSAPSPAASHGAPPAATATNMEERWELQPDLKRGIFSLVPHKPVYGLLHWTTAANENPSSPTRPFDASQPVNLDRAEGKLQLSFKTKLAEGPLSTPADLWFGYTQVSYWQVGNRRYSSPIRETNYEPEITLMYPINWGSGDFRMRFAGLTLNHQSNGRAGSLSRSWNRLIGEIGA